MNSEKPFLLYHAAFLDNKNPCKMMCLITFANDTLLILLSLKRLGLFMDASFDCYLAPFYHYLILMIFGMQKSLYVLVICTFMSHKNDEMY